MSLPGNQQQAAERYGSTMDNQVIQGRLKSLREVMRTEGIDYYMMPTADFHNSEYVSDYFKVREYFCNFSGSNGTLLVWQEGAGLWTDGRYFIQAENELAGTGVELFRMQAEGVPAIEDFLAQNMEQGQTLGFDGRVISCRAGKKLEVKLKEKEIRFAYEKDLAENIWRDRPPFPAGKVTVLSEELTGKSTEDKKREVMDKVLKEGADSFLLTKLDDLMWLFNIRGCDVECNPVAMSYAYLTKDESVLFIQKNALDERTAEYLADKKITVKDYFEIISYLKELPGGGKTFVDERCLSYTLHKTLSQSRTLVNGNNPTELLKAVKNPVELAHMEEVYLKDSVALTKFIYWLKTNIGKQEITEITAADYLEKLRRQIPECIGLSFPSISAYGANAAMMHYEPTPDDHAVLEPKGLYLIDSGGQYLGGTTDVTRTIALGPLTKEEKLHYTVVAAGMLQLMYARWIHGCAGRNLDIIARQPIWNIGLDYRCGTGHGVGYMLNVHEGPQNMRWKFAESAEEAVIEAGMDISNEPGIYIEGSHGIRIENIMVAENDVKNEYGQFMHFKTLTWVPLDMDAIEEKQLTETQRMLLYVYQREVYDRISPHLTEEEAQWLRKETRADNTFFLRKY